jgi:hypothetical protein
LLFVLLAGGFQQASDRDAGALAVQHTWATAVEAVGLCRGEAIAGRYAAVTITPEAEYFEHAREGVFAKDAEGSAPVGKHIALNLSRALASFCVTCVGSRLGNPPTFRFASVAEREGHRFFVACPA